MRLQVEMAVSLALLAAASAWGADPAPATAPATRPAPLIVATYNINCGLSTAEQLRQIDEAIEKTGADFVAIQEGNPALYKHLRRQFAKTYSHIEFDSAGGAGGFGWLSKLPLMNKRTIPKQFGLFKSVLAEVIYGEQTVTLANVHLQPFPGLDENPGITDVLKALGKTEPIRVREMELILGKLPAEGAVIILGDFNSFSIMAAPSLLRNEGYVDSFASAHKTPDDVEHITWRWPAPTKEKADPPSGRIDYIWHSPALKTQSSRVLRAGPSDHFPVASELCLAAPATRPATQPTTAP